MVEAGEEVVEEEEAARKRFPEFCTQEGGDQVGRTRRKTDDNDKKRPCVYSAAHVHELMMTVDFILIPSPWHIYLPIFLYFLYL